MPASQIKTDFDVAVIGAGVFGAWTAYCLQKSGKRVLLIDGRGAANPLSSSGDESRIMRIGYGADEVYSRSAKRSLALWKELFAQSDEELFQQTGVLWLAHENDGYPAQSLEILRNLGVPVERLNIDEAHARFPQINLEGIEWALFEPESGVLLARRAVEAVARASMSLGVEFLTEAVLPPNGPEIETGGGLRVVAKDYVFACGAWLPQVFPDLLQDRIHPTRQEVFYFGAPEDDARFSAPHLPVWIDFKEEAYGLPDVRGLGVKVAIDRHGPLFDPEKGNRITSEAGFAEARGYLARRLPELKGAQLIDSRVCQYENTSNGDFLIDRHPDFENVWLVGGGSGHGFKHGPAVGEYVAARIQAGKEGVEPRFSLATKAKKQRREVY